MSLRTIKIAKIILALVWLSACTTVNKGIISDKQDHQLNFFDALQSLCGSRYEGQMTYPKEGQDSFAGKVLVATFASCTDNQIKIPFVVGKDKSRTWIISKTIAGLQLKHDHRHADGTPDEINMYGGLASELGSSLSQSFAADAHTAKIIPAASTNVWMLSLSENKEVFTYYLERHGAPRFKAVLQKVEP